MESLFPKGLAMAEASKVFQLVEHYQEHVECFGDEISFVEFLWMHYNPDSKHEDASHHHERLPDLNVHSGFVGICAQQFLPTLEPLNIVKIIPVKSIIEYSNAYVFLFIIDVLNPPQ